MNTEKIKREYENAVYLQSYTEMKKVSKNQFPRIKGILD